MKRYRITLIIIIVTFFHILCIYKQSNTPTNLFQSTPSITINTYSLPVQKKTISTAISPSKTSKASTSTKTPPPSLSTTNHKRLLTNLQKQLSQLHTQTPSTSLSIPVPISTLDIDVDDKKTTNTYDHSYEELLIQTLCNTLIFPEHGSVTALLTINKTGAIINITIIQSESENNHQYLERQLMNIQCPPFNKDLKNENLHTFTITFCNHL